MNYGTSGIGVAPDVVDLGVAPLYRMLRAEDPFDDCPAAAEGLSHSCQEIRVVGTWAHQFHIYLELIAAAYGADIRRQVQQVILHSLNQYGDSGNQLESFLKLTREAVASYRSDPAGPARHPGVTLETYLAIVLLTRVPDSPYFFNHSRPDTDIPYDTVKALSRCLERGANRVKRYYQSGFEPVMSGTDSPPAVWGRRLRACLANWFGNGHSRAAGAVPRK